MSGLLIDGRLVAVDGVMVIGPHDLAWSFLSAGDGMPRIGHPHQITLHKTKADDPEVVRIGSGPAGRSERVAEFWQQDPTHSGAHIVTGSDGVVACLADVVQFMAWHARSVNPYSIGIETYEEPGGVVYQAALDATCAVVDVLTLECGIQRQMQRLPYRGAPLKRLLDGGPDAVGIFGHRDNDPDRGRWDPGDALFAMLRQRGYEAFDFDAHEDIETWRDRQGWLVSKGHKLVIDGIPGPMTTAALKAEGYRGGLWAAGLQSTNT